MIHQYIFKKIRELWVIAVYITILLLFANYEAERKAPPARPSSPVIADEEIFPVQISIYSDLSPVFGH